MGINKRQRSDQRHFTLPFGIRPGSPVITGMFSTKHAQMRPSSIRVAFYTNLVPLSYKAWSPIGLTPFNLRFTGVRKTTSDVPYSSLLYLSTNRNCPYSMQMAFYPPFTCAMLLLRNLHIISIFSRLPKVTYTLRQAFHLEPP